MNRNAAIFAVVLVLIGIGSGFYLLTFFGLLVLIPVLLSPSKPPMKPQPTQSQQWRVSREPPRRITPPPVQQYQTPASREPATVAAPPMTSPPSPASYQMSGYSGYAGYSAALFPTSIFPSTTMPSSSVKPEATKKPEERDELLEVGAILAILRLAFG